MMREFIVPVASRGVDNRDMDTRVPVLGIDFGGVINDGSSHPSGDDTTFLSGGFAEAMETPVMAGAMDAITRLNALFDGRVWIVSKCGPRIQKRSEDWLAHHHFFDLTGVSSSHLRFCRQRPEKADHCAELGVTHFVDDRSDVLRYLVGVVDNLFLFGGRQTDGGSHSFNLVKSWAEAEPAIRDSFDDLPGGPPDFVRSD
jgi:hypothetical protein